MLFDVVIVGGGPAGLSAALVLGRMRRRVLVADTGSPANAVSHGVGGFLGNDGTPPAELRALAREQISAYPTVEFREAEATAARKDGERFQVEVGGEWVDTRKLLLVHGVDYELPEIPGIDAVWGESAFHCPFCHGWEVRDKAIGVIATSERAPHGALLLRSLSDDIFVFSNGVDLPEPDVESLGRAGLTIIDAPVERVAPAGAGVRIDLQGGERFERDAIFVQTNLRVACDLAVQLGAELVEGEHRVKVDASGGTGVHGLRAAGDAGVPPQSVAVAVGSGATAAYAIHAELALEYYEEQAGLSP